MLEGRGRGAIRSTGDPGWWQKGGLHHSRHARGRGLGSGSELRQPCPLSADAEGWPWLPGLPGCSEGQGHSAFL